MGLKNLLYLVLGTGLLVTGCNPFGGLADISSARFEQEQFVLNPDYRVYNKNVGTAQVFFRINTRNLLYTRTAKNQSFEARVNLYLELHRDWGTRAAEVIYRDSALYMDRESGETHKDLIGAFDVPVKSSENFMLVMRMVDENRGSEDISYLRLYRDERYIRQAFLPRNATTGIPIVSDVLTRPGEVLLQYDWEPVDTQDVYVLYYPDKFLPAPPPFASDPGDKKLVIPELVPIRLDSSGYPRIRTGKKPGMYFFTRDTTVINGAKMLFYPQGFPQLGDYPAMADPLVYVSTDEEYNALKQSPEPRKDLEKFWIRRCGSKERARRVMRDYYLRVESANKYFTSFKLGWKTDRGMIFVIFGPPTSVSKRTDYEIWTYGREANMTNLSFSFRKVENPFSHNHYVLDRGAGYRQLWISAVETWRTGRVFSY